MVNELTDSEKEAISEQLRREEMKNDTRIMFVHREPFIRVHEMMVRKDLNNESEALDYMLYAVEVIDALRAPLRNIEELIRKMDNVNKRVCHRP